MSTMVREVEGVQEEEAPVEKKLEPVLSLKHATKKIRGKQIVKDLTFDVYPGEVFGFLGPNGAGKTTTIRMMVGLISISSGDITLMGKSIADNPSKALQHVGAIVENPELYKFLTGYQNLKHFARMIPGIKKKRIKQVVKLVGMEDRIKDKVKTYSLGMRQRLGVAQALLNNPSLLILDEPTNGLDPAGIKELREYLKKLAHEEGVAVIVSSHLLSEMELMCDRVAIIQRGELIEIQDIRLSTDQDKQVSVAFAVSTPEDAVQRIQANFAEIQVSVTNDGFVTVIDTDMIPEINAFLVREEIKVFGIAKISKTLEEKFMEITGGSIQ